MAAKTVDGLTLALGVGVILAVEAAMRAARPFLPVHGLVVLGTGRLIQIVLLVIVIRARTGGLAAVGLGREDLAPGLRTGLIWSLWFGAAAILGLAAMLALRIDFSRMVLGNLPQGVYRIFLYYSVGAIISPAAEELLFRGVVFGFLRRWGAIAAILGSTLVFTLAHGFNRGLPLTQIVGGLFFAFAYEKHRQLAVPLTIHILGNLAIFTLTLWASQGLWPW